MKISDNMPPLKIYKALVLKEHEQLLRQYLLWIKLLALRGLQLKYVSNKSFNLLYRSVSRNFGEKL